MNITSAHGLAAAGTRLFMAAQNPGSWAQSQIVSYRPAAK